jgi:hypothetical protein
LKALQIGCKNVPLDFLTEVSFISLFLHIGHCPTSTNITMGMTHTWPDPLRLTMLHHDIIVSGIHAEKNGLRLGCM